MKKGLVIAVLALVGCSALISSYDETPTSQPVVPTSTRTEPKSFVEETPTEIPENLHPAAENLIEDVYDFEPEPEPTPAPVKTISQPSSQNCDPNYTGCVPIASDVDCGGGSGDGPAYLYETVRVIGSDIYGLDRDKDGWACE